MSRFDANRAHLTSWDQKLKDAVWTPLIYFERGMVEVLNSTIRCLETKFKMVFSAFKVLTRVEKLTSKQPANTEKKAIRHAWTPLLRCGDSGECETSAKF